MLQLERDHPLPSAGILPEGFDAQDHPSWGMPYALPGLADAEHHALLDWIREGAPHEEPAPISPALRERSALE